MRIGFFGGTFDPPHRGHLAVARAAIKRLRLDRVLIAPVSSQPLKDHAASTSFEDRLAMVRLAVGDDPQLAATAVDGPRDEGRPNYTIDTLLEIKRSLADGDRLFCILGADSFFMVRKWHRAAEMLFVCDFIVAGRPGFWLKEAVSALPPGVKGECSGEDDAGLSICVLSGIAGVRSHLYLMPGLQEDVSATQIRSALLGDADAREVVAPAVISYIREKGLYRDSQEFKS